MGAETRVYLFTRQPWFNHLITVCPKCHRPGIIWDLLPATATFIGANMDPTDPVNFTVEEYASEATWRTFCAGTGKVFPRERFLSPREQIRINTLVAWAAYELEKGETIE
jgi:hypothetical protein